MVEVVGASALSASSEEGVLMLAAASHADVSTLFAVLAVVLVLIAAYLLYVGNMIGAVVGVFLAILVAVFLV